MARFRVLAIAVATGRIGYVLLENDKLVDWRIIHTEKRSPEDVFEAAKGWIGQFDPEVVVTEAPGSNRRKHGKTLTLMEAVTRSARDSDCISVTLAKARSYRDKYEEAKALAKRYPELLPRLARKPAFWLNEPRRMILFEALSLAQRLRNTE